MGSEVVKDGIAFDRNVARLEIMCDGEDPEQWPVIVHFQDSQYGASGKLVGTPQFGSVTIQKPYGEIKNWELTSGVLVSHLFPDIRELAYTLLAVKAKEDAAAARVDIDPEFFLAPTEDELMELGPIK